MCKNKNTYFCVGHLWVLIKSGWNNAAATVETQFVGDEVSDAAKILLAIASFFFSNIPSLGSQKEVIPFRDLKGTYLSMSKPSISIENWNMTRRSYEKESKKMFHYFLVMTSLKINIWVSMKALWKYKTILLPECESIRLPSPIAPVYPQFQSQYLQVCLCWYSFL